MGRSRLRTVRQSLCDVPVIRGISGEYLRPDKVGQIGDARCIDVFFSQIFSLGLGLQERMTKWMYLDLLFQRFWHIVVKPRSSYMRIVLLNLPDTQNSESSI